jgi:hypothetical protein
MFALDGKTKTPGTVPNFAQSAEQIGTVPFLRGGFVLTDKVLLLKKAAVLGRRKILTRGYSTW